MSYELNTSDGQVVSIKSGNLCIPLDINNTDYQQMLSDIKEDASCFTGTVPSDIQTQADDKLFAKQVQEYINAKARIAQYQLSVGRPESSKEVSQGYQEFNSETNAMEDVTITVVTPAIEALQATISEDTYDSNGELTGTQEVANPLITTDNAERASAQAIIDATPNAVKTHVDS